MKLFLFALLAVTAQVAEAGINEKIRDEGRLVLFNSRRLSGECSTVCANIVPETMSPTASPTKSPTASPTKSPTKSPTASPTASPTKSPTKSPTASPTASPTKSPTKSPTASPTASPTKSPTKSPTAAPITPLTLAEVCPPDQEVVLPCVVDTDCITSGYVAVDGSPLPSIFGSCPKCVDNQCQARKSTNGNLNCCKRTPGNDLVITNGCGANNVCVGFNDLDQCEVNQHALHCNPCCPEGNIVRNGDGSINKVNGRVEINPDACGGCENDGKPMVEIYPIEFCTTEAVKWKLRPNNDPTDTIELELMQSMKKSELGSAPAPGVVQCKSEQPEPKECAVADDCYGLFPNMVCPQCTTEGRCMDIGNFDPTATDASLIDWASDFASSVKGNLNCCKRTPGTTGIITNGCGANNICIGFMQNDQCEVNDKAAYCNPYCPDGNVLYKDGTFATDDKGHVLYDDTFGPTGKCPLLDNRNGADNDGVQKPMPRIFPLSWCNCRNVKWSVSGPNDQVDAFCNADGTTGTAETNPDSDASVSTGCTCSDYSYKDGGDACIACTGCTWKSSGSKCEPSV